MPHKYTSWGPSVARVLLIDFKECIRAGARYVSSAFSFALHQQEHRVQKLYIFKQQFLMNYLKFKESK